MNEYLIVIDRKLDKENKNFGVMFIKLSNEGDKLIKRIKDIEKDQALDYVANLEKTYNLNDETTIEYRMFENDESVRTEHLFLYEFMHKYIIYNSKRKIK